MNVEQARHVLHHWDVDIQNIQLLAQRENTVFKVTDETGVHRALRFHRPGYQTAAAITSELDWMNYLAQQGLEVPSAQPTQQGHLQIELAGQQVDLLSWLDGRALGESAKPLDLPDRRQAFYAVGRLMAQVHTLSDAWHRPPSFERQSWDIDGLLGEKPLWGCFWENPALTAKQQEQLTRTRVLLRNKLEHAELDFGLIHADMVRENVLIGRSGLQLIDFDDSGFGYRLFDLATALFQNRHEIDFEHLKTALISGYHSQRALDTSLLSYFFLMRALTYVGWVSTRLNEPGAVQRQSRFITTALTLSERFLNEN